MYTVEFYQTEGGKSELLDFIEELRRKASKDKNARIQYKQIILDIQLLEDKGNNLQEAFVKHVVEDIWELRPGRNRILYCYMHDKRIVLLHHFRKKSKKTPRKEIEKAKSEIIDYLKREGVKNENLERL